MKKLVNKEFEIGGTILQQKPESKSIEFIKVVEKTNLSQLLDSQLTTAPQGGFGDLKTMRKRMIASEALEKSEVNEELNLEDDIFEIILEAGRNFKPSFASKGMIEFKEYLEELENQK